ncbi:putative 2OG-Fe(II) oxygenase [Erythrobacter sp. EC-HK427]|uniref:putative 2OG-Fe(II) oxygenase n=1 Tax=Erythrobacter sp. EC-HK427 TaxID=2038396 RepID=UPI001258AC3B|nr:putative 2OG-Fe(II) oxygenase [Erythrobacter sp. EC-HK427]VVT02119.1 conserved hypothetical protein [Erythrobacter sp. EC-HK427]
MSGESTSLRDNALAAFRRGAGDAAALLTQALEAAPHDGALLIAEAEALAEAGVDAPFARLEAMLGQAPDWISGHQALARLKSEFGHPDPLATIEAALRKLGLHPSLWHAYLGLLAGRERFAEAADHAAQLQRTVGAVPELLLLEARYAGLAGDAGRGRALLGQVPAGTFDYAYQCARNALQRGAVEEAVAALDAEPAKRGDGARLWALREVSWRASGDARHTWLMGHDALVAGFALDLAPAQRSAMCEALRTLHKARAAPPSQSVRGGTQTRGALHLRAEPLLQELFAGFAAKLATYCAQLTGLPPDHPLGDMGAQPAQITASWSVRLTSGGHHVPHLHDTGRVSSACHLALPEGAGAGEGALELGRPPADMALALAPLAVIDPQPGRLILFPSFLYHGTTPFGTGERLSAVIDAG